MSAYRTDIEVGHPALKNWIVLAEYLLKAKEDECVKLMKIEQGARHRKAYMLRIHQRINYLRAHRERAELSK